ncbi:hypothetical protein [Ruminococcus flavefaciens]|uniref:hypothetical protein n=1 Tax=Ruminococcus flavefaciens TaxID=1265 RepID=UPI0004911627|nr:hypothetical protein [Ruminococcus flavefaciens]
MSEKSSREKKLKKEELKNQHNKRTESKQKRQEFINKLKGLSVILSILMIIVALIPILFIRKNHPCVGLDIIGGILLLSLLIISIIICIQEVKRNPIILLIALVVITCFILFSFGLIDPPSLNLVVCTFILDQLVFKRSIIPKSERHLRNLKREIKDINKNIESKYEVDEFLFNRTYDFLMAYIRIIAFSLVILPVISYNSLTSFLQKVNHSEFIANKMTFCITTSCLFCGAAALFMIFSKETRITSKIYKVKNQRDISAEDEQNLSLIAQDDIIYINFPDDKVLYKLKSELSQKEYDTYKDNYLK